MIYWYHFSIIYYYIFKYDQIFTIWSKIYLIYVYINIWIYWIDIQWKLTQYILNIFFVKLYQFFDSIYCTHIYILSNEYMFDTSILYFIYIEIITTVYMIYIEYIYCKIVHPRFNKEYIKIYSEYVDNISQYISPI